MRLRRLRIAVVVAAGCVAALLALQSAQAQTYTVLHTFNSKLGGSNPHAGLIQDAEGNLYGTAENGGALFNGVVFKLSPTGKETVLYTFPGGVDGGTPQGGVIRDDKGNFYGTTTRGGHGHGLVYKLDATGKETVLYSFKGEQGEGSPRAGVIRDAKGNLYGTTFLGGGTGRWGSVFKVDPKGKETILHRFAGSEGWYPASGLILDKAGNLFGTTVYGGSANCEGSCGTVFEVSAAGKMTVLYRFKGGMDGSYPYAGLVQDAQGDFFGTTSAGGDPSCGTNGVGCGTVFKLSRTGKETILYRFQDGADGRAPHAGVFRDPEGNLYGTTFNGGPQEMGTVFQLSKTGIETVLHTFSTADGFWPYAGVIRDSEGNLYGTTHSVGGTAFKLTP